MSSGLDGPRVPNADPRRLGCRSAPPLILPNSALSRSRCRSAKCEDFGFLIEKDMTYQIGA